MQKSIIIIQQYNKQQQELVKNCQKSQELAQKRITVQLLNFILLKIR